MGIKKIKKTKINKDLMQIDVETNLKCGPVVIMMHPDTGKLISTKNRPAISMTNGIKMWTNTKGDLSRLTGPAMEIPDGVDRYYLNGSRMSKEDWENHPEVIAYNKNR